MVHHPALQGRHIVVVGDYGEAQAWAERHDVDVARVLFTNTARQIVGLNPPDIHIVVMPGVRDWHNPYYFVLRTELGYMHSRGATLEWA
jgi:hypothetical protein